MKSLWSQAEAEQCPNELALRAYSSRLLGADEALVMHGGGNTSVKARKRDIFGDEEDVLYVKGSGWDLATIEPPASPPFGSSDCSGSPSSTSLADAAMARELRRSHARSGRPGALGRGDPPRDPARPATSTTRTPTPSSRSPTRPAGASGVEAVYGRLRRRAAT